MRQNTGTLSGDFRAELAKLCPNFENERFVIAFSGGLDSMALLLLCAELIDKKQLVAAHLNHQLRGADALRDEDFCRSTALRLGLEFISAGYDVKNLAAQRRNGIEEAARQARYEFLKTAAKQSGASFILTGHHANDQAETILMNLVKGSGSGGLAGMPSARPLGAWTLLRPLLSTKRSRLEEFLLAVKQPWVEDYTNDDNQYLRNAIRNDIIPRLEFLNPRLTESLIRMADILRGEEDFWRGHLKRLWEECYLPGSEATDSISLKREQVSRLTLAEQRRLIYEAFLEVKRVNNRGGNVYYDSITLVIEMLRQPRHRGLDLPGGLRAVLTKSCLHLSLASRLKN